MSIKADAFRNNFFNNISNYPKKDSFGKFGLPTVSNKSIQKKSSSKFEKLIKELDRSLSYDYTIQNGKKIFSTNSINKENGFLKIFGESQNKEIEEIANKPSYKYKEISIKIRQAKTPISAGQALLAAKRNVSEIKRQLGQKKGNSEELMLALSHAKRMEMVAKKKKRHIETEKLIENTKKADESKEKEEEAISEQEIRSTYIEEANNGIEKAEDEILKQREDLSKELDIAFANFGDKELEQLEQAMEMLETLEVINPHMSDEDFKMLKIKHRNSEEKSIVKADMEYIKGMFDLLGQKGVESFDVSV